jgi:hypothetical protein
LFLLFQLGNSSFLVENKLSIKKEQQEPSVSMSTQVLSSIWEQ